MQQQISTGRQVIVPSDNPQAASRATDLQRLLDQKAQVKTNLQTNQSYLSATDTALASVSDLLNEARGAAVSASGTTITDSQRAAAAQQIDSILQQLTGTANQQFNGRYLFAGSSRACNLLRRAAASCNTTATIRNCKATPTSICCLPRTSLAMTPSNAVAADAKQC